MNLSQKIEKTRAELKAMIGDNYSGYPFDGSVILQKSQELDNLIVQYINLLMLIEKQSLSDN